MMQTFWYNLNQVLKEQLVGQIPIKCITEKTKPIFRLLNCPRSQGLNSIFVLSFSDNMFRTEHTR